MALEAVSAESLLMTPLDVPEWVVEDLVGVGVTLLVGAPKIGKSWMALQLADAVSRGEPFWGFATSRCGVLDLELEDSYPRIQRRLFKVTDEADPSFRLVTHAPTLGGGLVAELGGYLDDNPETRLVIIDTLQVIRDPSRDGAYASDYRDVHSLKELADDRSVAIVLVHHTRKMGDPDSFNTVSGTNGLSGAADATLLLTRDRTQGRATLKVSGRDMGYRELTLEFRDCRWRLLEDMTAEEAAERSVPPEVWAAIDLAGSVPGGWSGTATQLASMIGIEGTRPAVLGKRLNEFSDVLRDHGIEYSIARTSTARTIRLVPL